MDISERVDYFGKDFLSLIFGVNDYIRNLLPEILGRGLTSIGRLPKINLTYVLGLCKP